MRMKIAINYKTLSVILILLLMVLIGQMGFSAYSGYMVETMTDSYTAGYGDGMSTAVRQLIIQTENCSYVSVQLGNVTKNLVDLACIQAP